MTEQQTRQMIQDVIGKPLAEISGQLNLLSQTIDTIHDNTTKTNGKVAEHEKVIYELKEATATHTIHCPQKAEIHEINKKVTTLEKMEVGRKAVTTFTGKQVAIGFTIMALIISAINLILK